MKFANEKTGVELLEQVKEELVLMRIDNTDTKYAQGFNDAIKFAESYINMLVDHIHTLDKLNGK